MYVALSKLSFDDKNSKIIIENKEKNWKKPSETDKEKI